MIKRSTPRTGEVYINADGMVKLGEQHIKKDRQDYVHSMNEQINDLLKEKVLRKLVEQGGIEILMAYLAYEAVPPLIKSFKGSTEQYMLQASRKEGVSYIYDNLDKILKEIKEENK